jgi:putative FmdB family regulatory protein
MCPKYDHYCSVCLKVFEVDKPMKEAGKEFPCPKCGKPAIQAMPSPAIHWRNTPKFHP